MDLNEVTGEAVNRHPWELSRTECVLRVYGRYLDRLHKRKAGCKYINVGAGDLYFDGILMARYPKDEVHAVDIGYQKQDVGEGKIHKYRYLEEMREEKLDYGMMMDSLEYMEDDVDYVRKLSRKIRRGGYLFFTLPAYQSLFSDHDRIVKNLRRYDRKSFGELLDKVPELEKVEDYYFYLSLLCVRLVQKLLRLPIDPEHKVTTGWSHPKGSLATRLLTGCLNLDFAVHKCLARAGIRLPGLSLLVVCRKK